MRRSNRLLWAAAAAWIAMAGTGEAQKASRSDYSVAPGGTTRMPRNYDKYYYSHTNGYSLSPFIVAPLPNRAPLILGPVRPFTDFEYSELVLNMLESGRTEPVTAKTTKGSVVEPAGTKAGIPQYKRAEVRVVDVFDRGRLLAETGEEIKLRGVRVPSERDPSDFTRFYAREATRLLRSFALSDTIFVTFEEPLRNSDGTLMGIVTLRDGTELNRLLVERGYARTEPGEFVEDKRLDALTAAEHEARGAKAGIWSVR